jgi:hypothetical protein
MSVSSSTPPPPAPITRLDWVETSANRTIPAVVFKSVRECREETISEHYFGAFRFVLDELIISPEVRAHLLRLVNVFLLLVEKQRLTHVVRATRGILSGSTAKGLKKVENPKVAFQFPKYLFEILKESASQCPLPTPFSFFLTWLKHLGCTEDSQKRMFGLLKLTAIVFRRCSCQLRNLEETFNRIRSQGYFHDFDDLDYAKMGMVATTEDVYGGA